MAKKQAGSKAGGSKAASAKGALAGITFGTVAAPPSPGCPQAPTAQGGLSRDEVRHLLHPTTAQLQEVKGVIAELQGVTSFATDLGTDDVDAAGYVNDLSLAQGWTTEATTAEGWVAHAKSQRELAWHSVLAKTEKLKPYLKLKLESNPALAAKYSALAAFAGARSQAAQRGAATRQKNKKKQTPPSA
jgi:hypothetical protein